VQLDVVTLRQVVGNDLIDRVKGAQRRLGERARRNQLVGVVVHKLLNRHFVAKCRETLARVDAKPRLDARQVRGDATLAHALLDGKD